MKSTRTKMFQKTLMLVLFFSFNSFAMKDMDHSKMDHSKMDHSKMSMSSTKREKLPEETTKRMLKALEVNEDLHSAYFEYDAKKVEAQAKNLKAALQEVKNPDVSKLLKFSITKLDEIKESADREKNNENYHVVSTALIYLVKKYDLGSKYNAYSCPMVKKNWIQNSEKIAKVHNPYAPGMPYCGNQDTKH